MKQKIYKGLFVTDLDGTLLADDKTVSSRDLRTLEQLRDRGIATVIATGRSDYSFFKLIRSLGVKGKKLLQSIDAIVVSTGAGILGGPDQKLVQSYSLSEEEVHFIISYLESLSVDYMIHKAIPETVQFSYRLTNRNNSDFLQRIKLYSDFATPLTTGCPGVVWSGQATEILCVITAKKGETMAAKILRELSSFSVIRATSPLDHLSIWVEIFPHQVSKSLGVGFLADRFGVGKNSVCAVGNDYNDLDLLLWAGEAYLVENGPVSLQDKFEVVSSNNYSGTTAAAIHWLEKAGV